MEKDIEIFEGKTFSSLVRDIYNNSSHKKDQINQIIKDLHSMIKDVGGATVVAPMIKDYLDVSVKNDDQLIKLSAVLQRLMSGGSSPDSTGDFMLSDAEKQQLYESMQEELEDIDKSDKDITEHLENADITEKLGKITDTINEDGT
tara:strand:- start:6737 stop:7174 length:438 start_codon:yes stop_codon:yes gene_type:complete